MNHRCPECGKPHPPQTKHCACGWCNEEKEKETVDHRCQTRDMRCENVGTICRSIKGNSKQWYCSKHWYDVSNFKK